MASYGRVDPGATGAGWIVWCVAVATPYLLSSRAAPWTMFWADAAMAAAVCGAAIWAWWRSKGSWSTDVLAAGFLTVSVVPLLQALYGLFIWPGEAVVVSMYVSAIGLTLMVARCAEHIAPGRLVEALWAALVIASLASVGMLLYQVADLSTLGVLIAPEVAKGRPAANLGQPNLLAGLLAWGLIGVWWGLRRRRIGAPVAGLAAAFLLMGVAITQSRSGWLAVAMLGVSALVFRGHLGTQRQAPAFIALGLWFAAWVLGWAPLSEALGHEAGRSLTDQASAGKRPQIWWVMLNAALQSPWVGYGWNQGSQAHSAVAQVSDGLHVVVAHAHNLVLDMVVWNGWPLGLILSTALLAWVVRQYRRASSDTDALLLSGIGIFLMHALLELPHVLFVFLAPVAIMMGTLAARHPLDIPLRLGRPVLASIGLGMVTALVVMSVDYSKLEGDLIAYRFRQARIGDLREPAPPNVYLLGALQQALTALRSTVRRDMPETELVQLRRAAQRHPSDGGLFSLARASALNHHPLDAARALERLCLFYPPAICRAAGKAWHEIGVSSQPELLDVQTPAGFAWTEQSVESTP